MIKKTFKQLKEVDIAVASLYEKNPKVKDSKFGYAYKRFADKNYYPVNKEFSEAINDVRAENALVDKGTGAMIFDPSSFRGFKYDKVGWKTMINEERRLEKEWDEKVIEVEPYICKDLTGVELSDEQKDLFNGLIINITIPTEKAGA